MAKKITIVPLHSVRWDLQLPVLLSPKLSIRDVEGMLDASNFSLWKDHISKSIIEQLPKFKIAIVDEFSSDGHIGREESSSRDLTQRAFVALRIIQPTRTRFSNFQCRVLEDGKLDLFSFTQPNATPIISPESETLNMIGMDHLRQLRTFLPSFIAVSDQPGSAIARAIKYYETGYSELHDVVLQFISWMMGLESTFPQIPINNRPAALIQAIEDTISPSLKIFQESPLAEHFKMPDTTVHDVLPDLFRLRNELLHGQWFPNWKRLSHPSLRGEDIGYPQILTEAAPVILRKVLLALIMREAVVGY